MVSFVVRAYSPADAEACAGIFDRAWHEGHPYQPRVIDLAAFEAHTRNETILVAETGEHGVVGFASVFEPGRFVHNLYIDPPVQGRGIGRALLEHAVALAGGTASLKCQTRNVRSVAFYRHLGWIPIEEGNGENGPWVRMHSP